jgi:putative Holliday junction resolvase
MAEDYTPGYSLLALDFGLRRIGIASGSPITGTASPLTTVNAKDGEPDWLTLDALIDEWKPDLLVLGLPFNSDGSESEMTTRVRAFSEILQSRYGLQTTLVDERYTSAEAEAILKQQRKSGLRRKKLKKADVDSMAATLIAESWMRS